MRVIKAPPRDLYTLLIDLGPRSLVLLEGETDFDAFSEWFLEREADLLFHVPGGGVEGVAGTGRHTRGTARVLRRNVRGS